MCCTLEIRCSLEHSLQWLIRYVSLGYDGLYGHPPSEPSSKGFGIFFMEIPAFEWVGRCWAGCQSQVRGEVPTNVCSLKGEGKKGRGPSSRERSIGQGLSAREAIG